MAGSQATELLAAIRSHTGPILMHSTGLHVKADGTTETIAEFMAKKSEDLQTCRLIYWYGQDARPDKIRPKARTLGNVYIVMFQGGSPIKGKDAGKARFLSRSLVRSEGEREPLPKNMNDVTGGINAKAAALVIDELFSADGKTIDLGEYTAKDHQRAAIWWTDKSKPQGGIRIGNLIAVGVLRGPDYAVWLK